MFQSLHWFGEGGELLALPDPVKEISSRPVILEEVDPAITVDYFRVSSCLCHVDCLSSWLIVSGLVNVYVK